MTILKFKASKLSNNVFNPRCVNEEMIRALTWIREKKWTLTLILESNNKCTINKHNNSTKQLKVVHPMCTTFTI